MAPQLAAKDAIAIQTRVIPALALTADEVQAWTTIQRADPVFQSPFYRPEYVREVAAVYPGIALEVA